MEIENKKTKIAAFNSIRNRYLSAIAAEKIQMEHQVRKFCVTPMIELVWGFVAGFGETGTYTEEEGIELRARGLSSSVLQSRKSTAISGH